MTRKIKGTRSSGLTAEVLRPFSCRVNETERVAPLYAQGKPEETLTLRLRSQSPPRSRVRMAPGFVQWPLQQSKKHVLEEKHKFCSEHFLRASKQEFFLLHV